MATLLCLVAQTAAAQDKPADRIKNAIEQRKKEAAGKTEAPPPAAAPVPPAPAATTTTPPPAPVAPAAPSPDDELYRCKNLPRDVRIRVNLKPDTDLKDLIAWVMGFTCKSFIFGNAISGRAAKVTVIAPKEMSPADAYRLFLVSLQTMGLTVVPKGNAMEIVESQRGRETPLPVYKSGGAVPVSDQVVRLLIRPEYVSVEDLNAIFTSMKSSVGVIQPVSSSGVLIVTDYGSVIDRMMDVLKEVDAPLGAEKIYLIPLKTADAADMAQKLTEIFGVGRGGATPAVPGRPAPAPGAPPVGGGGGGGGGSGSNASPSKIIADQRTNSLIVIGSERAYQRILALVSRLDGDAEAGGQIHVYYLNYAEAEELGNTLNALITGQQQARPAGQPGQPTRPPTPTPAGQPGQVGPAFEGTVRVTHDKATNALVIVSSAKDFLALKDVIKRLDIARRQVYVEAHILEVTISKTSKVGAAYHGGTTIGTDQGDALIFSGVEGPAGGDSLNSLNIIGSAPTLSGFLGGAIGPNVPGFSIPSFGVLFQILQSNSDVNVLSSPNILTTDNEQAEITVGQNIPYQAGVTGIPGLGTTTPGQTGTTTPGFGAFPFQSIQRQDVALTLKLKPHINDSDYMRLEVELEVNDLAGSDPQLGPKWSKRKVKSPIVVKDQQPVVIGGLISDKYTISETKVPLLGDIPIIGYLFKQTKKEKVKTNLLIFLTPYIVKDQTDLQRIFEQKMHERREFIESYSTFQAMEFEPNIDYRRKRGLLEDINKAVGQADEDARLYEESLKNRKRLEPGAIEMPPPQGPPPPQPPPQPK